LPTHFIKQNIIETVIIMAGYQNRQLPIKAGRLSTNDTIIQTKSNGRTGETDRNKNRTRL